MYKLEIMLYMYLKQASVNAISQKAQKNSHYDNFGSSVFTIK